MRRSLFILTVALGVLAAAPARPADGVDLLLTSRNVPLTGKLNMALAEKTVDKLIELDGISSDPIFLKINAHGDALEAAFVIVDTIRALKSPVIAVVQSRAYDAAAVIAVLCEKTWIYPNAVVMFAPIDKVSTELTPPKEPAKEFLEQFRAEVYGEVAAALGMKPEAFTEKVKDGWWLTAEQAIAAHVADGLVSSIAYQEIVVEQTEIKTTVTETEDREVPPAELPPAATPGAAAPQRH
jgi:ATP-dependent protease ClpP protease subunit